MKIHITNQLAGRFKLEAVKVDEAGNEVSRRMLADWFPNIILDTGLNAMGTGSYEIGCVVGSGNTTPAATQTALTTWVAGTTTQTSIAETAQASTPYYGSRTVTWRFGVGVATGNLSEIGITTTSTVTALGPLFSRALIVDGGGSPTTITVLSDEMLDATYELRSYPMLTDVTDTDTIDGVIRDITIRAAIATSSYWGNAINDAPALDVSSAIYSGSIGAITTVPAGFILNVAQGVGGGLSGSYVNNSYTRNFVMTVPVGAVYSIKCFAFLTTRGCYQIQFDPALAKSAVQTCEVIISISWTRYTIP
jgi:hypothetical protein